MATRVSIWLLIGGLAAVPAGAFNGHTVRDGSLTLSLDALGPVTVAERPLTLRVHLSQTRGRARSIRVRLGPLVAPWHVVGPAEARCHLKASDRYTLTFAVAVGAGAYAARYPLHVTAQASDGGAPLHAVRIVSVRLPASDRVAVAAVRSVPAQGLLSLTAQAVPRVTWRHRGGTLRRQALGWEGVDPNTGLHVGRQDAVRGGVRRRALAVHPPWRGQAGTARAQWRLALPATRPLTLCFATAIRDHTATEPPSDGVTFRVWVEDTPVFERHSAAKTWQAASVDLGPWAGRTVILGLETHPGPAWNTTCDSAYWAEPTIYAGMRPIEADPVATARRADRVLAVLRDGPGSDLQAARFTLAGGLHAAAVLGPRGLCDGALALGDAAGAVRFAGLAIAVLGARLDGAGAQALVRAVQARHDPNGTWTVRHEILSPAGAHDLTLRLWAEGAGLRIQARCPQRITDLALGAADRRAARVLYGHGYAIDSPEAFTAGYGGHNLSTSFVGFDFPPDLSLVLATDNPPDRLVVDPAQRLYTLRTHLDATLTLVPSRDGAFAAARAYRPLHGRVASPGFARKAGRCVLDLWGGRFAEHTRTVEHLARYGLTDALAILHVWQRWGYDYRLPDIYPPNPQQGRVAELQAFGRACDRHGLLWGLHDNYIDLYPDAEGFDYGKVCFTPAGQPVEAWYNRGREAQSYRWRPDRIGPALERNLRSIGRDLRPTASFVDVFTSIGPFDYHDAAGRFHTMLETRRCWGEAFRRIQETLGGAVTCSEAGHDQLIGDLDGADCQFLRLTDEPVRFGIQLRCRDWERVPWYDMVWHDRFSLHGVGYSGRYQSGRDRWAHGIESDDYLSAEVLTGHALMVDRAMCTGPSAGRAALRHYWLLQPLARRLATDRIVAHAFVDGDLHRQRIDWAGGVTVYVNRGERDWTVAGRVLPPSGFLARAADLEIALERREGVIVERGVTPQTLVVNARGYDPRNRLPVTVSAPRARFRDARVELTLDWRHTRGVDPNLHVFLHALAGTGDAERIVFQGDYRPASWPDADQARVVRRLAIPASCGPGSYPLVIGLWDPRTGTRASLRGPEHGSQAYRLGRLTVMGDTGHITGVRWEPERWQDADTPRWNAARRAVDFGPVRTSGACRLQWQGGGVTITPLPRLAPFAVALDADLVDAGARLEALDPEGHATDPIPYAQQGARLRFTTRPGDFAYRWTGVHPPKEVRP